MKSGKNSGKFGKRKPVAAEESERVGGAVVDSGGELWAKCIKKRRPEPPFDVLNF